MIAIVGGALANKAGNGGNAWARLAWVRGLERLGLETYFVEHLDPAAPPGGPAYFQAVAREFGFSARAGLLDSTGRRHAGALDGAAVSELAASAELLVNLGGHLRLDRLGAVPRRAVYVDDDPGYTQFWASAGALGSRLDGHDHYYTFGAAIGTVGCPIPTASRRWRAIRPPVVMADWPVDGAARHPRFTTVASWRGPYGAIEHGGVRYGQKLHELRRFSRLPALVGRPLELALEIDPAERAAADALCADGWTVVDPRTVAHDPAAFRRYVQGSGAEFSVAQGIYVQTRSGWFSDRSTRYLASGRPVLVQDTGFSRWVPVGEGLLAFTTMSQAARAIEQIAASPERHARAARELATEFFDSDVVLGGLLADVL